ncbi:hypothetical protein A3Q56_04070 [Intoshia linei]|uniref:Uncharacterized protein n=1 Tax=Intoshia linei TaxID=1819745 RepID=A0A177B381_9BILA|nr:hypothetical protein A3Q56_04070 [Intoshia linei]
MERIKSWKNVIFRGIEDSSNSNVQQSLRREFTHIGFIKSPEIKPIPGLIREDTWTLNPSIHDNVIYRSPSNTIGNNYSPKAKDLFCTARTIKSSKKRSKYESYCDYETTGLLIQTDSCIDDNRPGSPLQQINLIRNTLKKVNDSNVRMCDMQRYHNYINDSIDSKIILQQCSGELEKLWGSLLLRFSETDLYNNKSLLENIHGDINESYAYSLKKCIVNYILRSEEAQTRLNLKSMSDIHSNWMENKVFIDIDSDQNKIPISPTQFYSLIDSKCTETRKFLIDEWMKTILNILLKKKHFWENYLPSKKKKKNKESNINDQKNTNISQITGFFKTISSLLSIQLRYMTNKMISEFIEMFEAYYIHSSNFLNNKCSLLLLNIIIKNKKVTLSPNYKDCHLILIKCFHTIIKTVKNIPNVENMLFKSFKNLTKTDASNQKKSLFDSRNNIIQLKDLYENIIFESSVCVRSIQFDDNCVTSRINYATEILKLNFENPKLYLQNYSVFYHLSNNKSHQEITEFLEHSHSLEGLVLINIQFNMICLNSESINNELYGRGNDLIKLIVKFQNNQNREANKAIIREFEVISENLNNKITKTEELINQQKYLVKISEVEIHRLIEYIRSAAKRFEFLAEYSNMSTDDIKLNTSVIHWPDHLKNLLGMCKNNLEHSRDTIQNELVNKIKETKTEIDSYYDELYTYKKKELITQDELKHNATELEEISNKVERLYANCKQINYEENLLDREVTVFENLEQLMHVKNNYYDLWKISYDFYLKNDTWCNGYLKDLDYEEFNTTINNMLNRMNELMVEFSDLVSPRTIAEKMKHKIQKLMQNSPIIKNLCSKALRERHWIEISKLMDIYSINEEKVCFNLMLEYDVQNFSEGIDKITQRAEQEWKIEKSLQEIQGIWNVLKLNIKEYSEYPSYYMLGEIEDIVSMIDNHSIRIKFLKVSNHVEPFLKNLNEINENLQNMSKIFSLWPQVQSFWVYLKPMFGISDILSQIPDEYNEFIMADSDWKDIMINAHNKKVCIDVLTINQLYMRLDQIYKRTENIIKTMRSYLAKKRNGFARFWFISDESLMKILANSQNFLELQEKISTLFPCIDRLDIDENNGEVVVISNKNDVTVLVDKVNVNKYEASVENLLTNFQNNLKITIKSNINTCVEHYEKYTFESLITAFPIQTVLVSEYIIWTKLISKAIRNADIRKFVHLYTEKLEKIFQQLKTKWTCNVYNCAIMILNLRDIISSLVEDNNNNLLNCESFEWLKQMRYDLHDGNINVHMMDYNHEYKCDYLGDVVCMVSTSKTDRCTRSLFLSFCEHRMCTLTNDVCNGASQYVFENLSACLGIENINYVCFSSDYRKSMCNIFKGVVQCGMWCCMVNINDMHRENLDFTLDCMNLVKFSFNHQKNMINIDSCQFVFEGNCNFLFLLNMEPNNIGRKSNVKIPDSILDKFRTFHFIIPNLEKISKNLMICHTTTELNQMGKALIKYLNIVYAICGFQPNVVLILQVYKELNISNPQNENNFKKLLLGPAISKIFYPKISLLHYHLITDVFKIIFQDLSNVNEILLEPMKLSTSKISSKELVDNMDQFLMAFDELISIRNLSNSSYFMSQVASIYNQLCTNDSIFVYGPIFTGKSTCINIALGIFEKLNLHDKNYNSIHQNSIDFNALSFDQIFGSYNKYGDWSDGYLERQMKQCSLNSLKLYVLHIESVLDQHMWFDIIMYFMKNNHFYLNSGDIIGMPYNLKIIIETNSITNSSPLVIMLHPIPSIYISNVVNSECNFYRNNNIQVIFPHDHMFNLLLERFIVETSRYLQNDEEISCLTELCNWLFKPVIEFCIEKCQTIIGNFINPALYLQNFIKYFSTLFSIEKIDQLNNSMLRLLAMQSNLTTSQITKHRAPNILRLNKNSLIPQKNSIYDYYYEIGYTWKSWSDLKFEKFPLTEEMDYNSDLTSCVAQMYFSYKFFENKQNVVVLGDKQSGKSFNFKQLLNQYNLHTYLTICIPSESSHNEMASEIISKLERKSKNLYAPAFDNNFIIYVDDVTLPNLSIERQDLDYPIMGTISNYSKQGTIYNESEFEFLHVDKCTMGVSLKGDIEDVQFNCNFYRYFIKFVPIIKKPLDKSEILSILCNFFDIVYTKNSPIFMVKICEATVNLYEWVFDLLHDQRNIPHRNILLSLTDVFLVIKNIHKFGSSIGVSNKQPYIIEPILLRWINELFNNIFMRIFHFVQDIEQFYTRIAIQLKQYFKVNWEDLKMSTFEDISLFGILPEKYNKSSKVNNKDPKLEQYGLFSSMAYVKQRINEYLIEYQNDNNTEFNELCCTTQMAKIILGISRSLYDNENDYNCTYYLNGKIGTGKIKILKLAAKLLNVGFLDLNFTKNPIDTLKEYISIYKSDIAENCSKAIFIAISNANILYDNEFVNLIIRYNKNSNFEIYLDESQKETENEMWLKKISTIIRCKFFITVDCINIIEKSHLKKDIMTLKPFHFSRLSEKQILHEKYIRKLLESCKIYNVKSWTESTLQEIINYYINPSVPPEYRDSIQPLVIGMYSIYIHYFKKFANIHKIDYAKFTHHTKFINYCKNVKKFLLQHSNHLNHLLEQIEKYHQILSKSESELKNMKIHLKKVEEKLKITVNQTNVLVDQRECETFEIEEKKEALAAEEAMSNEIVARATQIRNECENDVTLAKPLLEEACTALNDINLNDIADVKAMRNPHVIIKLVMESVCVLLEIKPERKKDRNTGKPYDDYWSSTQKLLSDIKMIDRLKLYDKDNIPQAIIQKLREKYISNPIFDPKVVRKASIAVEGLCKWVIAIDKYDRISKEIAPKRDKLLMADKEVITKKLEVQAKSNEILEMEQRIEELKDEHENMQIKKNNLMANVTESKSRLKNAQDIYNTLEDESEMWQAKKENHTKLQNTLMADVCLFSAFITYMGVFQETDRNLMVVEWYDLIEETIEQKPGFVDGDYDYILEMCNLRKFCKPITSKINSKSKIMLQNVSIIIKSNLFLILYDPDDIAEKYIRFYEKENNIQTILASVSEDRWLNNFNDCLYLDNPILVIYHFDYIHDKVLQIINSLNAQSHLYNLTNLDNKNVIRHKQIYFCIKYIKPCNLSDVLYQTCVIDFSADLNCAQKKIVETIAESFGIISELEYIDYQNKIYEKQLIINKYNEDIIDFSISLEDDMVNNAEKISDIIMLKGKQVEVYESLKEETVEKTSSVVVDTIIRFYQAFRFTNRVDPFYKIYNTFESINDVIENCKSAKLSVDMSENEIECVLIQDVWPILSVRYSSGHKGIFEKLFAHKNLNRMETWDSLQITLQEMIMQHNSKNNQISKRLNLPNPLSLCELVKKTNFSSISSYPLYVIKTDSIQYSLNKIYECDEILNKSNIIHLPEISDLSSNSANYESIVKCIKKGCWLIISKLTLSCQDYVLIDKFINHYLIYKTKFSMWLIASNLNWDCIPLNILNKSVRITLESKISQSHSKIKNFILPQVKYLSTNVNMVEEKLNFLNNSNHNNKKYFEYHKSLQNLINQIQKSIYFFQESLAENSSFIVDNVSPNSISSASSVVSGDKDKPAIPKKCNSVINNYLLAEIKNLVLICRNVNSSIYSYLNCIHNTLNHSYVKCNSVNCLDITSDIVPSWCIKDTHISKPYDGNVSIQYIIDQMHERFLHMTDLFDKKTFTFNANYFTHMSKLFSVVQLHYSMITNCQFQLVILVTQLLDNESEVSSITETISSIQDIAKSNSTYNIENFVVEIDDFTSHVSIYPSMLNMGIKVKYLDTQLMLLDEKEELLPRDVLNFNTVQTSFTFDDDLISIIQKYGYNRVFIRRRQTKMETNTDN